MKKITTFLLLLFALGSAAQTDSVFLNDGRVFVGYDVRNYHDRIIVTDTNDIDWMVMKTRVSSVVIAAHYYKPTYAPGTTLSNQLDQLIKARQYHNPRFYNNRAWKYFAAGMGTLALSGILVGVGYEFQRNPYITDSRGRRSVDESKASAGQAMTYAGFATAGLSFSFNITSMVYLFKRGREHSFQVP